MTSLIYWLIFHLHFHRLLDHFNLLFYLTTEAWKFFSGLLILSFGPKVQTGRLVCLFLNFMSIAECWKFFLVLILLYYFSLLHIHTLFHSLDNQFCLLGLNLCLSKCWEIVSVVVPLYNFNRVCLSVIVVERFSNFYLFLIIKVSKSDF